MSAPLIVTALFGPGDDGWLQQLRQNHYPAERNQVPAHLTLFHQLPPSLSDELSDRLAAATATPPPPATLTATGDLLAKSIGGGLPLAAFGGRADIMATISDGRMWHFGTYNGNPLAMAAAVAVDEVCTQAALDTAEVINDEAMAAMDAIIVEYDLPAHTVGFGVKGAVTWSPTPVRNYRDYKRTDFGAAELSWLWGVNRGILTPPGLDEQWLVSLAHTKDDMDLLVAEFAELAEALRA